ncbi:unnamed protein product [Brassicogethes aeneus]|uniref:Uncharacterized protein n=1 Tax=Brassicogethes aeneus TaxID=1431903 RepID=A0A9P0FMX3_BRAAE|nr:unnamed protein product [Brassicogethes aeneus]
MKSSLGVGFFIFSTCMASVFTLPTSLVEEIKSSELREPKVKRTPSNQEENSEVQYFNKPSAIKRGANLKTPNSDQQALNEWSQAQAQALNEDLSNLQSSLYNNQQNYDDKTIAEYEKGFQYGANKEKLDEALENAVLKSEYYDPGSLNQYRYYGADDKKRRRRAVQKLRMAPRFKRDVELTPEEIITLLNLYEKSRQNEDYRPYQPLKYQYNNENYDIDTENNDGENWLEGPVYPHVNRENTEYLFDEAPQVFEKRGKWGNFEKQKRFMVAKKRSADPTRELRYLNGPNQNDYYTLSHLLSNQREPDVPLYHRLIL